MADTIQKSELMEFLETIGKIQGMNHMGAREQDGSKMDRGLVSDSDVIPRNVHGGQMVDGFNFAVDGDQLVIKYQGLTNLDDFNSKNGKYEEYIIGIMKKNANWIKAKYKDFTGKSIILKDMPKSIPVVRFEYRNAHQAMVYGAIRFEIANFPGKKVDNMDEEFSFEESLRAFRNL
jgi:hypothetical protein